METPVRNQKQHSFIATLVTVSLQILLWSSIIVLSIKVSLFATSSIDASLFLTDVLCIGAAGTSLLNIGAHVIVVKLIENVFSKPAKKAASIFKLIILFLSCTMTLLWISVVSLGIILILSRQPKCQSPNHDAPEMWRKGRVCVLQRAALVASMLALIVSLVLLLTYNISYNSFTAGLFGSKPVTVCLSPSDFQRNSPMVKRDSTLSFKCRSALLSPIPISSPLRMSSPLRNETYPDDEKVHSSPSSVKKTPLVKSLSVDSTSSSGSTERSIQKPSTAYVSSAKPSHYPPGRMPAAHTSRKEGAQLYSPRQLPKNMLPASSARQTNAVASSRTTPPPRAMPPRSTPPRSTPTPHPRANRTTDAYMTHDTPSKGTTSMYTSRRVSSTFIAPSLHTMEPPRLTTHPSLSRAAKAPVPSPPSVYMPMSRPANLYTTRRAPTPYTPPTQVNEMVTPVRDATRTAPVSRPEQNSSFLAPPPAMRRLHSGGRGVSFASITSSVYSRAVNE